MTIDTHFSLKQGLHANVSLITRELLLRLTCAPLSQTRPTMKTHPSLALATTLLLVSITSSNAAVGFEKQVLPILDAKCLGCHKATHEENGKKKEPKGELRLDAAWAMLKGGEHGAVLKPGKADSSDMYLFTVLPKDDDNFMPPKGDPLTAEEAKLLKTWIDEGADFGGWEGNQEGRPAEAPGAAKKVAGPRVHDELYKKLNEGLKPVAEATITKAKEAGAQVTLLKADMALLRADFLTGVSACTDEKITALLPMKDNITQLDLGRTVITDAALDTVAQMPRLTVLDLRQTKITDAGLAKLAGLKNLQTLNLYGTEVTDAGLKHLAALKSLKSVALWQSKATEAGVKQLSAAIPGLQASVK